ncbi:MAG: DUF86 domain-containing protein [Candidatus Margulisbacteria bacterium]|jgi:uncharacterized protein with HEPN domain|nr:DUF86 domain-containing protein [Candidatus Margulisiibacteriota bacterium]
MADRESNALKILKEELLFIRNTLDSVDKTKFLNDEIIQHAIAMSLISIGEAANRLSDQYKEKYPEIEWPKIIAVRNIAAHGYGQLDMQQIWQAMVDDIPLLEKTFL